MGARAKGLGVAIAMACPDIEQVYPLLNPLKNRATDVTHGVVLHLSQDFLNLFAGVLETPGRL